MESHCISRRTTAPGPASRGPTLIYFIPGNPGLVGYYNRYLSLLKDLLESSGVCEKVQFHIYGQNLAGFSDDDHEPFTAQQPPRDVEYQIRHSIKALSALRAEPQSASLSDEKVSIPDDKDAEAEQPYHDVILMGHSVGSYIALEVYRRIMERPELVPDVELKAAILLFPTIVHIAHSSNGKRVELLRRSPLIGKAAPYIATGFLKLWPRALLSWFIRNVLGFPREPATVTTNWLKSRDGIWQALHMGMDEMQVIREAKWDEELWEIVREAEAHHQPTPKFFFYFGKNDHWVNNQVRDAFIKERRAQIERTRLMIDDGNLPHAFCIKHSDVIAKKVAAWIEEIYAA